jgi:predicted transcriptional regulator
MVRDPFADEAPGLETLLDALDDEDCREIVRELAEPMTAQEIADASEVPLSTTYRKLELLTEASLLEERVEVRPEGHHRSVYAIDFEAVVVALAEDRDFEIEIARQPLSPDRRLESLWSEVRKET